MSALSVLEHPGVRTLGFTLLHFVWQGALVALALALVNAGLRGRSARLRYAVASAALLAMLALPVATFVVSRAAPVRGAMGSSTLGARPPGAAAEAASMRWARVEQRFAGGLPWVVAAWSLGVLALSVRFLGGWLLVRRLARAALPLPDWHPTLERLSRQLRVWQPVRVCESMRVEVPTVVGWLRPLILLPAATLAGLTPLQLEALLAHELAHVRRLDYLANLVQRVAETLLFYHPAVWWASGRMRVEREHCCDDAAVAVCGDPLGYARTLATLAGLRAPATVVAASGGSLFTRVKRLVAAPDAHEPQTPRRTAALLTLTVLATLGMLPFLEQGGRAASAAQGGAIGGSSPAREAQGAIEDPQASAPAGIGSPAQAPAGSTERGELTLEAIMELSENGVTPEYIDRMEALGYRNLSWATLIDLRSNGVTPEMVEELRALGYAELSPEQLIELANQGVTPDFVRELADLGFQGVGVDELVRMREEGVTPEFIREMKTLGVSARGLDNYAELVNQGVTPDFVSELKRNGYDDLSSSWLIELRDHGVDAAFANEMKLAGFERLSPEQLIELRDRGVDAELLRRFNGNRR